LQGAGRVAEARGAGAGHPERAECSAGGVERQVGALLDAGDAIGAAEGDGGRGGPQVPEEGEARAASAAEGVGPAGDEGELREERPVDPGGQEAVSGLLSECGGAGAGWTAAGDRRGRGVEADAGDCEADFVC